VAAAPARGCKKITHQCVGDPTCRVENAPSAQRITRSVSRERYVYLTAKNLAGLELSRKNQMPMAATRRARDRLCVVLGLRSKPISSFATVGPACEILLLNCQVREISHWQ
jgi:hypothetical protein